jgi:hypothetical protein
MHWLVCLMGPVVIQDKAVWTKILPLLAVQLIGRYVTDKPRLNYV